MEELTTYHSSEEPGSDTRSLNAGREINCQCRVKGRLPEGRERAGGTLLTRTNYSQLQVEPNPDSGFSDDLLKLLF